ncbi:MAG: lysophospholipid acyltransferase family protein, partial [Actinomycetota bacterium]
NTLTPPAVFVLNPSSHLDAATIVTSLPTEWRRKAVVGAASDYFFDVWYRSVSTTMFFNAFPIARGGGLRSARLARTLLADGWSLVLFPEGTRTSDGWVGQFRTGAAWLAMEGNVPVIPVALSGTYQAMPRGRSWPAPGRPPVRVRFGKPVWPEKGERPAAFSDRLRFELGKVQEEERSGWWQSLRAEANGQLVDPSGPKVAPWRRHWESSRPVHKKWARSIWEPEKDEWMHERLWTGTSWVSGVGELPPGGRELPAGRGELRPRPGDLPPGPDGMPPAVGPGGPDELPAGRGVPAGSGELLAGLEGAAQEVLDLDGGLAVRSAGFDPDDGLDALGWGEFASGERGDAPGAKPEPPDPPEVLEP